MLKIMEYDIQSIENPRAWIRRIIINKAIDFNRKYFDDGIIELNYAEQSPIYISTDQDLHIEDILKIIGKLPTSYKTVVNLHIVEQYKFHEIAEMLEISEGGAKALFYKGKEKLINLLKSEYKEYGYK